jgi:hypothetical protein
LLLIALPLFIAVLGAALAVGVVIALSLILAVLILIGFVAVARHWAGVCCSPPS